MDVGDLLNLQGRASSCRAIGRWDALRAWYCGWRRPVENTCSTGGHFREDKIMQTKTHWQVTVDRELDDRLGHALDAAELRNQSGPTMTEAQIDTLLGGGTDHQARQFARYAISEAAQDGVFETGWD
jgi:hypothetical protein